MKEIMNKIFHGLLAFICVGLAVSISVMCIALGIYFANIITTILVILAITTIFALTIMFFIDI